MLLSLRQTMKSPAVLTFVITSLLMLVFAGCKEEPAQNTPVQNPSSNSPEPQQTQISEADGPAEQTVTEKRNSPAETREKLDAIAANARQWGAVNKAWYGKPAPDFKMKAMDGTTHQFSEYKGKKVLLVFWATWCPPCRAEIPDLKELQTQINPRTTAVVAVAGSAPGRPTDTVKNVSEFASQMNINYDVYVEEGEIPEPFGVGRLFTTTGVPGAFLIDAEGIIRLQTVGIVPTSDSKALLDAL